MRNIFNLLFFHFLFFFLYFSEWSTSTIYKSWLSSKWNAFLSPAANKKLFTFLFISLFESKSEPNKVTWLKVVLIPRLLTNSPASCSLIDLGYLLSHIAHFFKGITLRFLIFITVWFLLYVFFSTFQTINCFAWSFNFYWS